MMLNLHTRSEFTSLLTAQTLRNPTTDPAIIYVETGHDPIHISRLQFTQKAEEYASAMHSLGIQPGDVIIIAHTQDLESMYAFWGALLMGAIPSMFPTLTEKLDPDKYFSNMALLVQHSNAKAVLTTADFAVDLKASVPCPVYSNSEITVVNQSQRPDYLPASDQIAFLQHSSGTTGLQKGVALSHQAVLNQLASYASSLELNAEDVIVSWLPLYHDMGLIAGFLLPIMQGIPLVIISPFDWVRHPAILFQAITDFSGTLCWLPNFAYNHCTRRIRKGNLNGIDLSSIRSFINCSEPVHQASHLAFFERFQDYGVTLKQLGVSYAMAENTFAVTQTPINQAPQIDIINQQTLEDSQLAEPVESDHPQAMTLVSCGKPIANVEVKVLDSENQPLAERRVGEIAIHSDSMLTGYFNRPKLNENLLVDGWYLTGDMGYMVENEVYIIGRKKDLIIAAGKNVYPQDIEAIVNNANIDGLKPGRNVVFGVWDENEGTQVIAIVAECTAQDAETRQSIVRNIRHIIGSQTTITARFVTLVDEKWLTKTSSGKIARNANRAKWEIEFLNS